MSDTKFSFDHIHIISQDPKISAQWYEEIFGLKPIKELDIWTNIGPLFIGTEDKSVTLAL